LPKPSQKTVTIKKETYQVAKKKAEKAKKTVAGFVTDLILENIQEA